MEEISRHKKVIVYCAGNKGEKVYTQLITNGIEVLCFCDNGNSGNGSKRMGLDVYSYEECRQKFPDAVYVVANKYWIELEIGEILEKDNYIKNKTYFLSSELEGRGFLCSNYNGLVHVLEKQKVILLIGGEDEFADLFIEWGIKILKDSEIYRAEENNISVMVEKYPDALWILLRNMKVPVYTNQKDELKEKYIRLFNKYGIKSYSTYFYSNFDYLEMEKCDNISYIDTFPVQKRGLYIAPRSSAGMTLLGSVFDGHPGLLFLGESQYFWKLNIYLVVKYVRHLQGPKIPKNIIKYVEYFGWDEKLDIEKYRKILYSYFREERKYSEREIFTSIYFGYYELLHGKYNMDEKPIIVLELHNCPLTDVTLLWMKNMGFEMVLIEMVRKPYMVFGSEVSYVDCYKRNSPQTLPYRAIFNACIKSFSIGEQELEKIRLRFEDLKLYPDEMLHKLCQVLGIVWNDSLLTTTYTFKKRNGEVSGFGIKPVYYPYEECMDAFDKYRLDLVFHKTSKAYGYSFVEKSKIPFTMEEINKLFLFPFKFEDNMEFSTEEEGIKYKKRFRSLCSTFLEIQNSADEYTGWYNFGEYLKAGD